VKWHGITWNNIDFEKGTVKIEKAYMRVKKQSMENGKIITETKKEFKDLKSKDSYRVIGLKENMLDILKIHKEEQKELAKQNNKIWKETDWVFTTKTYKGYVADYTSDKFRKVMNKIKIKNYEELTVHDLRHTFCSYGIMGGVKVEEMKELLGHSNIRCNSRVVLAFR
jgi:integrase